MAQTLRILAQAFPSATALTGIYTVPSATATVISTITVCNLSPTATTFRLSVAYTGALDSSAQYVAFNAPIEGNDTIPLTLGITLGANDVLRVWSTLPTLAYNVFGQESS